MIVGVVVPWSLQSHAHWARIRWVPFVSPPIALRDIVGNVLLYVPFGYFAGSAFSRHQWLKCMGSAALLSCITEIMQVFGHGRFPSVQDGLMNVLGAAVGLAVSRMTTFYRERLEQGASNASD